MESSGWDGDPVNSLENHYFYLLGLGFALGHVSGERNGNSLQYSCLENPTDRAALWATVHGVTKSQMRLRDFHSLTHTWGHVYGAVTDSVIAIV